MATKNRILLLTALFLLNLAVVFAEGQFSAFYDNGRITIQSGLLKNANVWAQSNESALETGWHTLQIKGNENIHQSDDVLAYVAGYIEGYITPKPIEDAYKNFHFDTFDGYHTAVVEAAKQFVLVNWNWTKSTAMENTNVPFWRHVQLITLQAEGMYEGYKQVTNGAAGSLTFLDFLLMQNAGDMSDILTAVEYQLGFKQEGDWLKRTAQEAFMDHLLHTHCSALVRVADNDNGIFISHDTWTSYAQLLRTYKVYTLPFSSVSTPSKSIGFSSTPSWLSSLDDYFVLSNGMVVTETTNGLLNDSLFKEINPQTLMVWMRTIAANRLASTPEEWTQLFSIANSGTYNNQWIILGPVQRGQPIPDGSLWIAEQIPNLVVAGDVTDVLRNQNYWPSYNIPYFEPIFNASGFATYAEKHGSDWSYSGAPRAKIFAQQQGKVNDLEAMQGLMQYNDYQNDPLEEKNPCIGISSRCDLAAKDSGNYGLYGGIDTKLTDATILSSSPIFSQIKSGPTFDDQPVFEWTSEDKIPHYGMATVFDFPFYEAPTELVVPAF